MNLNATKRPFGHLDVSVGKTVQKQENHVMCLFKITLYVYAINIRSPNSKTLKKSYFELSALSLAYSGFNFLYVSRSCNHSNVKVTRIDIMLSADCV